MTENRFSEEDIQNAVHTIRADMDQISQQAGRDPAQVRLMAVTKTRTAQDVNAAIAAGIRLLGENKAQELCARYESYNLKDCEIHFIGVLQSNKVRQIIDKVTMIESVDSIKLAGEISRQAVRRELTMEILLEVNIGEEESKSGFLPQEVEAAVREIALLPSVLIKGLMAIPPVCHDSAQSRAYFEAVQRIFIDIKGKKIDNVSMEILSMGMSDDYKEAIPCGANIVRIGTSMFGPRYYSANT